MSARTRQARIALVRSLSTMASTAVCTPSRTVTGIPPPPAAITTQPSSMRSRTVSSSTMSWGTGLGTTRRQPRPESSRTWYPVAFAKTRASVSVMKAPMGFS